MSATAHKTAPLPEDIRAMKGGAPIVSLTAYTTPMARMMDAHCDFVLVGDSVGMVLHGMTSTLGVTMEMMILHAQAVARGLSRAMLVVDMPFGSYEESPAQAFRNAARLMRETGAAAVKLEDSSRISQLNKAKDKVFSYFNAAKYAKARFESLSHAEAARCKAQKMVLPKAAPHRSLGPNEIPGKRGVAFYD